MWTMQFPCRIAVVAAVVLFIIFVAESTWNFQNTEDDQETKLLKKLAVLETKVGSFDGSVRALRAEFAIQPYSRILSTNGTKDTRLLENEGTLPPVPWKGRLNAINIYNALPYLLDSEDSLTPALVVGKQRDAVSMVIGIPTVKRPTQSYLLTTLQNVMGSMLPAEKNDTVVIVLIADTDMSFVESTLHAITKTFKEEVDIGLIEIVAPAASYYPDLKLIKGTLGDSEERTRWRTKQNLDYIYLMMYAQHKGTYYVQLEDDVLSKKGFVTTMKTAALETSMTKKDWFMLDFCQLGFIGKLFRSQDLWKLIDFMLIFYQDKPGDWLLSQFFTVRYCKLDFSHKRCVRELAKYWKHFKPSLFQHIGMVSSLTGKVQKLKDKQFGKLELFVRHDNPTATVQSTIKHYGKFSLDKAYQGSSYFWGLAPDAGDVIQFTFNTPQNLKSYRFVSGNAEHPSDKICNATLEVSTREKNKSSSAFSMTPDGFLIIDEFDELGILQGDIPEALNPIRQMRIVLKNASENWVILSEIWLQKSETSS